jgi:hypothetical protein
MVDIKELFSGEEDIETDFKKSPKIILQILLLDDLNNLKQSIETYNILREKRVKTTRQEIIIRARLKSLWFINVRAMLKRTLKPEIFAEIQNKVNSNNINEVLNVIDFIIDVLDQKKFLRLDSQSYDYTDTEAEAERYNL